ncbi:MAG TPA: hypothetical protein VHD62_00535 [Opitutaceae bacterium]|nr:hypothetical protein [Opitutaceae bacterium]
MLISKLHLGLALVVVAGISTAFLWEQRENAQLRTNATKTLAAASGRVAALQQALAKQTTRATAAEADVAVLLKRAKAVGAADRSAPDSARDIVDTVELLNTVKARASQLAKEGKLQEALDEYVQCYREIETKRPGGVECQSLMGLMKSLGRKFPPAQAALSDLRDAAMAQWQTRPASARRELTFEIALLNEHLDQGSRTLELYDALRPDADERPSLAMIAFRSFVEARRYNDALIGKSFGRMLGAIDAAPKALASQPADRQSDVRRAVLDDAGTNIEVLTGAGKLDDAKLLTEKLLAFDDSDMARAEIRRHVERAQPPKS